MIAESSEAGVGTERIVQVDDLVVNLDRKTVAIRGMPVYLTGKEYQMLELLAVRKGETVTKEMFLFHLYTGADEPEIKVLDIFICKLKKKLADVSQAVAAPDGENYIEPVWGRGYVLGKPESPEPDPEALESDGRPRAVIGPYGRRLTLADLPSPNTKRWVIRRKAEVVAAVRGKLLSEEEARRLYNLGLGELDSWQRHIDMHGIIGLRVTRIQQYQVA